MVHNICMMTSKFITTAVLVFVFVFTCAAQEAGNNIKTKSDDADNKPTVGGYYLPFAMSTYNPKLCGQRRVSLGKHVGQSARIKKTKVVVMSFLASYCESCMRELDSLMQLHERYKDYGLFVMNIGIDKDKEGMEKLEKLVAKKNIQYPVVKDNLNILAKRYGVENVPVTFVINKKGKIIGHFNSYDENVHKQLVNIVYKEISKKKKVKTPEGKS